MQLNFTSMASLCAQYQAFIFDIWGVIHDGNQVHIGVINTLNTLIMQGKRVIFLSNAPRPGYVVMKQLQQFGVPIEEEMVYTSGDAVRTQLIKRSDKCFQEFGMRFYHLGEDRNQDLLSGLSLTSEPTIDSADFLLLSAFLEEYEGIDKYQAVLEAALQRNLPCICANPDIIVPHNGGIRRPSGTIAAYYAEQGGAVYYYGKPYKTIYDHVLFELNQRYGIAPQDAIMIGDTLETDILGAKNVPIHSALVLTGNVGSTLHHHPSNEKELHLANLCKKENIWPNWVLNDLQ